MQPLLSFPHPHPQWDDLLVTTSNEGALKTIQDPSIWPTPVVCLYGPAKSGVTVTLNAWSIINDALPTQGMSFDKLLAQMNAHDAFNVAVDDADLIRDETDLLTLIAATTQRKGRLLLGAHVAPQVWRAESPDLQSRLASTPTAALLPPDETMVMGRLRASAERYFLRLSGDVLYYLSQRLPPNYEVIEAFVTTLSEAVTFSERPPTIPFIRDILEKSPQVSDR